MTYFSFEDQRFEEYEEYFLDYYGSEGQINYQEPVYQYYYPNYRAPPIVKYENRPSKYDFSRGAQGDYFMNYRNANSQNEAGVRYQYEPQEDEDECLLDITEDSTQKLLNSLGEDDENTITMEDTTSSSTPIIPKFLYNKTFSSKSSISSKKRRPIKKVNTRRITSKTFGENKLGKVEEVEETSTPNKRTIVALETVEIATLSQETPVKLVQTSDPEKSASKLLVPSITQATIKQEVTEKNYDMSSPDKNFPGSVNSKYYSLGNVNLKSNEEPPKSDDVIAWKGKSMPDTSVGSSSMCLDTTNEFKPSTMSTDCTCITIDSEEYREFVKQINKIPQMQMARQSSSDDDMLRSETSPPIQIGALLKTVYDANNNNNCPKHENGFRDLTLDGRTDFKSEPMPGGREGFKSRKYAYKKRQTYVNPLAEVPLHTPLKVLFGFTSFGQQKHHCKKLDDSPPQKKRSVFVKIFRSVIYVIGYLQSVAYNYALRYILFI